jgi:hypothetical protein
LASTQTTPEILLSVTLLENCDINIK